MTPAALRIDSNAFPRRMCNSRDGSAGGGAGLSIVFAQVA